MGEENIVFEDYLLKRLRHLLESEFISSFDEVDANGNYKRDISEADRVRNNKYVPVEILASPFCRGCQEFNPTLSRKGNYFCVKCEYLERCRHMAEWLQEEH